VVSGQWMETDRVTGPRQEAGETRFPAHSAPSIQHSARTMRRPRAQDVSCLDHSPTQESATKHSCRGPSPGRVQQWTSAQKTPPKLPFLPFFGRPGATTRCQNSIRKSFRVKHIGPVMGVPGRSGSLVGIGAPNLPHRFPPHVHYLELPSRFSSGRGGPSWPTRWPSSSSRTWSTA
jgi:hypothetical protein